MSMKNFIQMVKDRNFLYQYQFKMVLSTEGFEEYDPNDTLLKDVDLYMSSSSLPSRTITNVEIQRYGVTFAMPGPVEFERTLTTTIRMDADLEIHKALTRMQEQFSDLEKSGGGERGIPNYVARIYLLDKNMNEDENERVIVLKGVFPGEVGAVELSHESTEVATCDVNWTFAYWFYDDERDPLG